MKQQRLNGQTAVLPRPTSYREQLDQCARPLEEHSLDTVNVGLKDDTAKDGCESALFIIDWPRWKAEFMILINPTVANFLTSMLTRLEMRARYRLGDRTAFRVLKPTSGSAPLRDICS